MPVSPDHAARDSLLAELRAALDAESWAQARSHVDHVLDIDQGLVTYRAIAELRHEHPLWSSALTPCSVALLGTGTLETSRPYLIGEGLRRHLDVTVHVGPYNQYLTALMEPAQELVEAAPDLVVLYLDFEAVTSRLFERPCWTGAAAARGHAEGVIQQWRRLQEAIASRLGSLVLWPTLAPFPPGPGILGDDLPGSPETVARHLNDGLRALVSESRTARTWDLAGLMSRVGLERWEDRRLRIMGDVPCAHAWWPRVARTLVAHGAALKGKACKVALVDADNTLWHGIVGEDGVAGLSIQGGPRGDTHRRVQSWLLGLKARGVLLAVVSKNNPEDVQAVFEGRDDMLLRREDVAAWAVGWEPKPNAVQRLLGELKLGVEQCVFLDDSNVERAMMRAGLPELTVPELPADATQWPQLLSAAPWFETLAITAEDELRTQRYLDEQKRTAAMVTASAMSAEAQQAFFEQLEVVVEAFPAAEESIPRLAQLCQRTNQFNFTTLRLSEQDIRERCNEGVEVIGARVRDRYGDYGVCGLIILRLGDGAVLDNLLLSCRALGRGVEQALRALVLERVRARGYDGCTVRFVRSRKNRPAEAFLATAPVDIAREGESQEFWWPLDAAGAVSSCTAKLIMA